MSLQAGFCGGVGATGVCRTSCKKPRRPGASPVRRSGMVWWFGRSW